MGYFIELECKNCNKKFITTCRSRYAYKIEMRSKGVFSYFCSWKCLTTYRREHNLFPKLKYTKIDKWGNIK